MAQPESVEWVDVPGLEMLYGANRDGKIFSKRARRVVRQHLGKGGYMLISTRIGGRAGKTMCFKVHRLIALTFNGAVEGKNVVNHKDGVKTNNRADNLEWCTPAENSRHAYETGLASGPAGERMPNAKLTDRMVRTIRERYVPRCRKNGARAISRDLGISHVVIIGAIAGSRWAHVA
jgi:hypothetical protein